METETGMQIDCRLCRFADHEDGIRHVRETVFVAEQGVPLAMEWDELDDDATHAVAMTESGRVIATARLLLDAGGETAHLGRMAVLADWRRRGIASRLLHLLCEYAHHRGAVQVCLNAQLSAVPFYVQHGFVAQGPVFDDAGIPHRRMCRAAHKTD